MFSTMRDVEGGGGDVFVRAGFICKISVLSDFL